ncbi:MAG: hypothetical protein NTX53_11015 [candidate division WOR-3 bacterium]|nr:hypothetical protein [candidate division WOR-3 bacterium]
MGSFYVLAAFTVCLGLLTALLLNRWFRADMKQCITEIENRAPGASDALAANGFPNPNIKAKLYGAVGVFVLLVLVFFGAGFSLLNRDLNAKEAKLKALEYEQWDVKAYIKLNKLPNFNANDVKVTVRPPDVGFTTTDPVSGVKLLTVKDLSVQRPAKQHLPSLYVGYPGYGEEVIHLKQNLVAPGSEYIDTTRTVMVAGTTTLSPIDAAAKADGYSDGGTVSVNEVEVK